MNENKDFKAEMESDYRKAPVRVAFVTRRTSPAVKFRDGDYVMTFPETLLHAAVAVEVLVVFLVWLAMAWNAPLEQLANPMHTPNPAKAPWYFLGLQELLHYFPPVVAGVLVPGLVVIAMVVIPYFRTNLEERGYLVAAALVALLVTWRVWPVLVPTVVLYAAMVLPSLPFCPPSWRRRLVRVTLSDWIMTWFVVVAVILTVMGVFFRGPGWKFIWPWQGGVRL